MARTARLAGRCAVRAFAGLSLLTLLVLGVGPLTGRYRVATVLSGSMAPTMDAGSVVFSTPQRASAVSGGQVISFQVPTGTRTETHRIVEVVSGGPQPVVRTQGDANGSPDPWLARLDGGTVWRARFTVPRLGFLLEVLRRPVLHRLTTLAAPALFLIACLAAIWRRPARTLQAASDVGTA